MLDDKLKATDYERTNEEMMEMAARESYMQWLKDNEKRSSIKSNLAAAASCSGWDAPTSFALPSAGGGCGSNMSGALRSKSGTSSSSNSSGNVSSISSSNSSKQQKQSTESRPNNAALAFESFDMPYALMLDEEDEAVYPPVGSTSAASSDGDILAKVLALSHQEYLDSLKMKHSQQNQSGS